MGIIGKIVRFLVYCLIIMLLWNYVVVHICNVNHITYLQAIGLRLLCVVLTVNFVITDKLDKIK